jgi:hypothetical protein
MAAASDKQMEALFPKDEATLAEFRKVVGGALRAMVGPLPNKDEVIVHAGPKVGKMGDYAVHKPEFGRRFEGDRIVSVGVVAPDGDGEVAIWVHPRGKASLFEDGKLVPAAQALLDKKISIMAIDVLQVGEQAGEKRAVNKQYAGYTFGYNRPLFADQVRDIVTAVGMAKSVIRAKKIHLIGWEKMGPAVIMAKAISGDAVERTAADMSGFRFDAIEKTDDPMLLPGAVKYGGLPAFTALCAPGEIFLHNAGTSSGKIAKSAYDAANAGDKLKRQSQPATAGEIVEWLAR